jgi:hypothetical protein
MIEPRRLFDEEAASELGEALREARAQTGTQEQLARLWHKLGANTAAPAEAPASAVTAVAGKGLVAVSLLALGLMGIGAFAITREKVHAPARSSAGGESRSPMAPVHAASPSPSAAPAGVAATMADQEHAELSQQAGAAPAAGAPPPRARRRYSHARAVAVAPLVDPEAEIALLTGAEQALELSPRRTLALLGEHARRFPEGVLAQEREVLAVDAELALGRTAAAAQRARAFLARFPGSAHRHRLESLLASPPSAASDHKTDAPRLPTAVPSDRRRWR